jgi:hypothetical protein
VDNSAPSATRPQSTYKSGKAVQTSGATSGFGSGAGMEAKKLETFEYFVAEYAKMLEENLDDCIANFDKYMKPSH